VSRALDQWAYLHQVTLDFSRPGKPTDNALVESFNRRLRDECLNTNWFLSLDGARRKIEARASTMTRVDLTLRWATFHPASLLNRRRGTAAHEPGLLTPELD
jgi:putative transposase